jgi:hypothetical protein
MQCASALSPLHLPLLSTAHRYACVAALLPHHSDVAPSGPLGAEALSLFHTRFHTVPKLEDANPSVIKW